jgi:hypothetical protein
LMRPWRRICPPVGPSSPPPPVRSHPLQPSQNMGIARCGEPAGRLRMGKTPNPQRVKRERVVNVYSRMFQEEQIPIVTVTVDARRASDLARTRHVSPAGIRASAASCPIRRLGEVTLPITLEGVVDTRHHHHSRRSPPRTCLMLQPAGRITIMHLSQAGPIADMIPTTPMLLTRVTPTLRMSGPASRAVRHVVEATPINPADMTSEIRVRHGSRRHALPVRPTTIGVNRD